MSEADAHTLIEAGVIRGGMIPKVRACLGALTVVQRVQIVNGGEPHVLLRQISQEQCVGTTIVRLYLARMANKWGNLSLKTGFANSIKVGESQ